MAHPELCTLRETEARTGRGHDVPAVEFWRPRFNEYLLHAGAMEFGNQGGQTCRTGALLATTRNGCTHGHQAEPR
jgi:hypothetical protein